MTVFMTVLICKEKSDLSARLSMIEMRGGTVSATVIGKDRDLSLRQG